MNDYSSLIAKQEFKSRSKIKWGTIIKILIITVIAISFLYPLFMVLNNSFKTYANLLTDVFGFPKRMEWSNYPHTWDRMNFPQAFLNTLFVTISGALGIIFFGSMAAYKMARTKTRLSAVLFIICIAPMLVPFHSIMITLSKVAQDLHIANSLPGLVLMYWGLGAPMAIFLYHGFLTSVPTELDEAATVDGCNSYQIYLMIVLPLLKPITITILVLNVLWIWNDFLLPLLMVNSRQSTKTLQLAAYQFFGQYVSEWHYIMSSIVLSVTPVIVFFLAMQKYIIRGIIAGAVKG